MELSIYQQEFDALPQVEKFSRLDDYLGKQRMYHTINNNKDLQDQIKILENLKPDLISRFGKFIIINKNTKEFVNCCDGLVEALDKIYELKLNKDAFIYQMPSLISINA
jgi:hypothetical protein